MNMYIIVLSAVLAARPSLAGPYLIPVTEENLKPIELETKHSEGKGKCVEPTFGQLSEGAECFEYYQQGPCKKEEVFACNSLTGFGECIADLCAKENEQSKLKSGKDLEKNGEKLLKNVKKIFAPLDGSGKCVELGSKGCKVGAELNTAFIIDSKTKTPLCAEVASAPLVEAVQETATEVKKDEATPKEPETQEQANFKF